MAATHHQTGHQSVVAVLTQAAQRPPPGHTPFAIGEQYKPTAAYVPPTPLPPPPGPPTQALRYPNANKPDGIRPWIKDKTFRGCNRCHSQDHDRASECPGRVFRSVTTAVPTSTTFPHAPCSQRKPVPDASKADTTPNTAKITRAGVQKTANDTDRASSDKGVA